MTNEEIAEALGRNQIFSSLDDANRLALAKACSSRTFRKGETIIVQGEPGENAYVVLSGQVKIFQRSSSGDMLELIRKNPYETFGEVAILDGGLRTASAMAAISTEVIVISREIFIGVLQRAPETIEPLLAVLGQMVRKAAALPGEFVFHDLKQRIANRLLDISNDGQEDLIYKRRITQTDIAEMVGAARQSVNVALRELQESGAIAISPDGIRFLNVDLLKK